MKIIYPNPFHPSCRVHYGLEARIKVMIEGKQRSKAVTLMCLVARALAYATIQESGAQN